jgi:AcrR family transcriptional regulator
MDDSRNSRTRALEGAERLFRLQGYAATGLTEILKVSGSPKGSFYFHFPQGKQQLASEVLEIYGNRVERALQALATRHYGDPAAYVRALCLSTAKEMEESDWRLGCAAQNIANELAPSDSRIADQLAEIFARWVAVVGDAIKSACPSREIAEQRATAIIAALEGARALARATRASAPFEAIADSMVPAKGGRSQTR